MRKDLHSEEGSTAIVIAMTMLVILGMLAVAVDIGFGFSERRIDQTGADAAALAGSLELVISDAANGLEASIDRVYAIVDSNLGRTVPYADWQACTDPNALFYTTLTDLGASNGSDCISLSEDFNTYRVRLPNQAVDTSFGVVIGADSVGYAAGRVPEVPGRHRDLFGTLYAHAFAFQQHAPLFLGVAVHYTAGVGFDSHNGQHGLLADEYPSRDPLTELTLNALGKIVQIEYPGWGRIGGVLGGHMR